MKALFYAQHWTAKIAKILAINYFKFFLKNNFFVDFLVFKKIIWFDRFRFFYIGISASYCVLLQEKKFVCVFTCLSFICCHIVPFVLFFIIFGLNRFCPKLYRLNYPIFLSVMKTKWIFPVINLVDLLSA